VGKAIIAVGVLLAVIGILGIPPIADVLPLSFSFPSSDSHTYYRVVRTGNSSWLVPTLIILAGLALCRAGLVVHRTRSKS